MAAERRRAVAGHPGRTERPRLKPLPWFADGPAVHRTRETWRTSWVFVGFYLVMGIGAVISFATADTLAVPGARIPGICISAVAAVAAAFFSARAATAGVFTDETGIRIRNPFMTARLRWDDIDRFELYEEERRSLICVVILSDGSVLRAYGIRGGRGWLRSTTGPAEKLVDGLNAELAAARGLGRDD